MNESPLPAPSDSPASPVRDANGRFSAGNAGGPGNPFARQVAQLRSALINAVTATDIKQIAEKLVMQARAGNLTAAKLLFQYVLGKPKPMVNPDTLDVEEWRQVYRPIAQAAQELPKAMQAPSIDTMCGMVRIMQPTVLQSIGEFLSLPEEEFTRAAGQGGAYGKRRKHRRGDERNSQPSPSTNGDFIDAAANIRVTGLESVAPQNGAADSPSTNGVAH